MRAYVGTSGFSYKPWKGAFYPEKIKDAEMLAFYATRLTSVEINNTFYRMPAPAMLETWAQQVPDAFRFVLKTPKQITHIKRLKEVASPFEAFCNRAVAMKDKLGPLLVQTPPNLKIDVERLSEFLALVPKGIRAAFEFRHTSWFVDEVYELLSARDQALCIAESDALTVPFVPTATWGYLRLREIEFSEKELEAQAQRVRGAGWQESFVFFKHEDAAKGPAAAEILRRMLA
ncbi:MAG: DUF72 domain-containing protein [Deltaproteobacteria bacterium]|nr:DUF72 domain-containing protein [Deltaproteobacteria bacterium]